MHLGSPIRHWRSCSSLLDLGLLCARKPDGLQGSIQCELHLSMVYSKAFQPQHDGQLEFGKSLLWGPMLCLATGLAASSASTSQVPVAFPPLWQMKMFPDMANCLQEIKSLVWTTWSLPWCWHHLVQYPWGGPLPSHPDHPPPCKSQREVHSMWPGWLS